MCQIDNFLWPLREPLVCYKILRRNPLPLDNDYLDLYSSIYWHHTWVKGFVDDTNCTIKYNKDKIDEDYYSCRIEGGFYHAFTKLEDAENELIHIGFKSTKLDEYVIAKMIIPVRNNVCFMGRYYSSFTTIQTVAAKRMIFDSVIETRHDIQNKINKARKKEKQSS